MKLSVDLLEYHQGPLPVTLMKHVDDLIIDSCTLKEYQQSTKELLDMLLLPRVCKKTQFSEKVTYLR